MQTIPATKARTQFFGLLKQTAVGHAMTRISSKEGNVVLISEDEYESLLETAELLQVEGFVKSIQKADREIKKRELLTMDEVFGK